MCLDNFVKSPLNYTGNKSRLLKQILPLFPKNINRFVDLCCGGASVGLNVKADEIICIDTNTSVIKLLRTLKFFSEDKIINKIESIINEYHLSDTFNKGYDKYRRFIDGNNGLKKYNSKGYLKLRDFFNKKQQNMYDSSIYLFALLSYGFNNDIRFNSSGNFNMPIGKTDFNASIRNKLSSFKQGTKNKNIDFYDADFRIVKELGLKSDDFVYIDPPYLITNAVYNENGAWDETQEKELLNTLDYLNSINVKFALSNILSKYGEKNLILHKWIKKNKFKIVYIDYHYRSASYNKKNRLAEEKEVVVLNYGI